MTWLTALAMSHRHASRALSRTASKSSAARHGRASWVAVCGWIFLAPPHYSQRAVFASLSAFFILNEFYEVKLTMFLQLCYCLASFLFLSFKSKLSRSSARISIGLLPHVPESKDFYVYLCDSALAMDLFLHCVREESNPLANVR